ncbi:MAG: MazG-like family protein [Patescibacteria group bacterium]
MKELEKSVLEHLRERRWDELRPGDIAKSIMIEGAELLELFQWANPELADVKKNAKLKEEIGKELADVMIYALEMSVLLGFDTEKIVRDKLALAGKKYPAALMRKMKESGGEPGTEAAYYKIKRAYRAKEARKK